MSQPLAGLKVLDLTQVMAGPYCCMLLADMGADVIKVEPPGVGDQTRRAMGFRMKGADSAGFFALNRNKRSIELDLKNDAGRETFHALAREADVVVENYRPGVTKRLGIDYPTLAALNPQLVYASISGFGQTGPWSQRPGLDLMAQALTGAMSAMGHPGTPPVKSSIPFADLGSGLFAAYAILSAVIGRQATGEGRHIDASLFETALGFAIWETAEYWGTGKVPTPIGSANRMSAPYQAVRAADGYFVIGASNQKLWMQLCEAIDAPDLLADERFVDNVARVSNREVMIAELEKRFARRPAQYWIDVVGAAGVPVAPIVDYQEALSSEQAEARNMVMEVEHPVEGPIKMLGFPVKASGDAQQMRYPPPLLGQHTTQVLQEFGFDEAAIGRLRDMGAFGKNE